MSAEAEWQSYSGAPPSGAKVCALDAVVEGNVLSIAINSENGSLPVLLTRKGSKLHAFVNACPHQYLPLDYQGKNLLSADGSMLMCASHGARFSIETGDCVDGPAMGCALARLPVIEVSGQIQVA